MHIDRSTGASPSIKGFEFIAAMHLHAMERFYSAIDAKITHAVFTWFRASFGVELTSTPPTKGLLFVDSPTPAVLAASLYVLVVIGGLLWIRARDLKPRVKEPVALQELVLVHNFVCTGISLYMSVGIVYQAVKHRYSFWNNAYDPKHKEMALLIYMFYMSKYLEFMDTIIMILKRSTRQITFLHVYHHTSVAPLWWIVVYGNPGGEAYFSAALNSGVHVFMYAYYFLAGVLRNNPKLRAKYLFWARYLTQAQMLQFLLNVIQAYYHTKIKSPCPMWLCKLLFYYMVSLLCLFGNFYIQKYIKPLPKRSKTA